MRFHIATMNIARLRFEPDDPRLADFVNGLDYINALSDVAPGFVWRLQDGSDNATEAPPYDDERMILNLSVWETIENLQAFCIPWRTCWLPAPPP